MKDDEAIFLALYEQAAREDPRKVEKPALAIRKADIDPVLMRAGWGPDWQKQAHERRCALCRETVIVRPVFKDQKLVICWPCAPKFLERFFGRKADA